jgi:hypothetical protein
MNRFRYVTNQSDNFPNGLRKYQVMTSRDGHTIVVFLKHYRGVTKCLKWNKPGSVVDGKTNKPISNPYSVSYIFDKWVYEMFKPFDPSLLSLFKQPKQTIKAWQLLFKAKRGNLHEVA